jgi:hypothetical protein
MQPVVVVVLMVPRGVKIISNLLFVSVRLGPWPEHVTLHLLKIGSAPADYLCPTTYIYIQILIQIDV